MGYTYGRQIVCQTLRFLADTNIPSKRLSNAYSEIGVLTVDDTNKEIFQQIVEWQAKYLAAPLPELREQTIVTDPSLQKEIDELIDELVWICIRVIEAA